MGYTINEVAPGRPTLVVDKREFRLTLISLSLEVDIIGRYGSLNKMLDLLRKEPQRIIEIMWLLMEDKAFFNYSFLEFEKTILQTSGSAKTMGEQLSKLLTEVVSSSLPLIKNIARQKEISELQNAAEGEGPCYAVYYDTLAKRYGYTLDQFYSLTLRNIHLLLKVIGDKSYEELEVQAALAGRKLKPRMKFEDITEEQEEENVEQAVDALKRLQEEYAKKNKDK